MNSPKHISRLAGIFATLLLGTCLAQAQPVGQWDFNSGNLSATVGSPLTYIDGPGGQTEIDTRFGTTTSLGIPNIGGVAANVMRFPKSDAFAGYNLPFSSAPNGGGSKVNQWTLIMDMLWTVESATTLRGLIETDGHLIEPNAELFVDANGALGVDGQFSGQIRSNTWYRIGLVVDTTADVLRKYINGTLVGTQSATTAGGIPPLDGRWAIDPSIGIDIFNDDNFESAPGYVNSIQLRNVALRTAQMQLLGAPTAAGIPLVVPPVPFSVVSWTPKGPFANPTTPYGLVLDLGDNTVDPASVTMRLDGNVLAGRNVTINSGIMTVSQANLGALPISTEHSLVVSLVGSIEGTRSFTNTFRVAVLVEDFESVQLGPNVEEGLAGANVWAKTPPLGWVLDDSGVPGAGDPANDGVTEWAGWSFANATWWATAAEDQGRLQFTRASGAVAIADPDEWDDRGHPVGMYNALMQTPTISVAGLAPSSLFLRFDSSWRPECCDDNATLDNDQTAQITVSYNGGAPIEVMHWSSVSGSPNFHPDSQNEGVTVQLNNPPGATTMVITFGLLRAENDWWWAIDNLVVTAGILPPTITSQPDIVTVGEGDLASLTITATGGAPLTYQWFQGTGPGRTPIPGATGPTLNIPNVRPSNAGTYTVQVSNPGGTADSGPIQLVVLPAVTGNVTDQLVVHLKFDGNASDSSVRGNNGAEVGAPTYVPGRIGQALRFSTAGDGSFYNYVTLGMPDDLKFGTDVNFSIAFWTRFTSWDEDPSFLSNKNWDSGGNAGWVIATAGNGGLQWNAAPSRVDYDGPGGTLADDQWHHVVWTWDRTGLISTYLDGVQVNNTPNGASRSLDSGLPTNIGQDGTGTYGPRISDGTIDDVGIWRRVLTEAEVKSIFKAALDGKDLSQAIIAPPVSREMVAYLPFDGNLTDATGRGNNGVSVGNTPFVSGQLGQAVSYRSLKEGTSFNYVSLGRPTDLNFGTSQSFAVSFWARLNSWSADPAFLANKDWDSGNNPGWVIATDGDGRIQWNIAATATGASGNRRDYDSAGGIFTGGGWHHVVVSFERLPGSGRARTYVDGLRLNETTWAGADNQLDTIAPRNTNIGQDGIGDYTDNNNVGSDGMMDELVFWRRALADEEVEGLYAAGILGVPANGASPALTLQLPPSNLQITRINNGTIRLTWEANAGVRLQKATTLGAGSIWTDVPGTLSLGVYETPIGTGPEYYQLRRH